MSANTATIVVLKIKVFENKVYDVIISVCDVPKNLSLYLRSFDQSLMRDSMSISAREVIITSIL